MNETEWSGAHTLLDMLQELERNTSRKWSARKAQLFACACCRRVWRLLIEAGQRAAVEVAERAADKLTKASELYAAHEQAVS